MAKRSKNNSKQANDLLSINLPLSIGDCFTDFSLDEVTGEPDLDNLTIEVEGTAEAIVAGRNYSFPVTFVVDPTKNITITCFKKGFGLTDSKLALWFEHTREDLTEALSLWLDIQNEIHA